MFKELVFNELGIYDIGSSSIGNAVCSQLDIRDKTAELEFDNSGLRAARKLADQVVLPLLD